MGSILSWTNDEYREDSYKHFCKKNEEKIAFTEANKLEYIAEVSKCYFEIPVKDMSIADIEFISNEVKKKFFSFFISPCRS